MRTRAASHWNARGILYPSPREAGIAVIEAKNVDIVGCASHALAEDKGEGLVVTASSGVVASFNNFENVNVLNSQGMYIYGNPILGRYIQYTSIATLFENTTVTSYSDLLSDGLDCGVVNISSGTNNQVINNQINGEMERPDDRSWLR